MKRVSPILLITALFFSCSQSSDNNPGNCTNYLTMMTWPAFVNGKKTVFYYNSLNQLTKTIYWNDSVSISRADTFYYLGSKLMQSAYSLNGIDFAHPYAFTEWIYSGDNLILSKYYVRSGSSYPVYTTSGYTFDDSGRIATTSQVQGMNVQKTRFEYDANGDLKKVWLQFNTDPETLYDEYFDYDNNPNPFYKQPLEFDYDMYLYNTFQLSKHNYHRHTRGSNDETYQLTYYTDGKVKTIKEVSNPFPAVTERMFGWGCR